MELLPQRSVLLGKGIEFWGNPGKLLRDCDQPPYEMGEEGDVTG